MMEVHETFRPRRAVLYQGMFYSVVYALVMIGMSWVLFLDGTVIGGPARDPDVVTRGLIVALFAAMFLGSLGMIGSFFVERFRIQGSSVFVRSLFQNRAFDVSDIERVSWTAFPAGGGIRFRVGGRTVRLGLSGYAREERLRIVRIVRDMVPDTLQEDWGMFCHKVAIPLRENVSPLTHADCWGRTVLVTRGHYDRLFVRMLFVCAVVGIGLAWWLDHWQLLLLPFAVFLLWIPTRSAIPKRGSLSPNLAVSPVGRVAMTGLGAVVLFLLVTLTMKLGGVSENVTFAVSQTVLGVGMICFFILLVRGIRAQLESDRRGAETAVSEWDTGETEA